MKTAFCGAPIVFGLNPDYLTMPITNLPADCIKVRVRFRPRCVGIAFVQTSRTIEKWFLHRDGEKSLKLGNLIEANCKV